VRFPLYLRAKHGRHIQHHVDAGRLRHAAQHHRPIRQQRRRNQGHRRIAVARRRVCPAQGLVTRNANAHRNILKCKPLQRPR